MIGRTFHSEKAFHVRGGRSIREVVFGVNDGLVSITGLVVGVTASRLNAHEILVTGLAAVVAATVSMGLGAYLATVAQNEYFLAERAREVREVQEIPEEERREIERIFRAQGYGAEEVQRLTAHVTADTNRWVDFMMKEELGIAPGEADRPWLSAAIMALAVVAGSLPPMLPYLVLAPSVALRWAIGLAVAIAFGLGVVKARATLTSWWQSGLKFVAVATVAVVVGIGAGSVAGTLLG